jgi:hypothetical protein
LSRRRRVNQIYDPVLSVEVSSTKTKELVYLLAADRPIRYGNQFSRIVYIGTTKKGVSRIAGSASRHIGVAADQLRGLRRLDAFVVAARSRRGPKTHKGVKAWFLLEHALLLKFWQKYGSGPILNGTGKPRPRHEFDVFAGSSIQRIIERYQ